MRVRTFLGLLSPAADIPGCEGEGCPTPPPSTLLWRDEGRELALPLAIVVSGRSTNTSEPSDPSGVSVFLLSSVSELSELLSVSLL